MPKWGIKWNWIKIYYESKWWEVLYESWTNLRIKRNNIIKDITLSKARAIRSNEDNLLEENTSNKKHPEAQENIFSKRDILQSSWLWTPKKISWDDVLKDASFSLLKEYEEKIDKWNWIDWEHFLKKNNIGSNDQRIINKKKNCLYRYIKNYPEVYKNSLSENQKLFLVDFSPRILLQARAGSWKTTTLVQKTHFLLNECYIKKEEIIFLAFNKSATQDVNKKIGYYIYWNHNEDDKYQYNAMTFHSLAGRIGYADYQDEYTNSITEKDEESNRDTDFTLKNVSRHVIQELFENEEIRKLVYEIFKTDTTWEESSPEYEEFVNNKWFSSKEYYEIVRWMNYQTLDGKLVKSKAEKWIGDFLFEQGIWYNYEWTIEWWNKKNNQKKYSPDFRINKFSAKPDYIRKIEQEKVWIEFWWIDEYDPEKQINPDWDTTWEQYREEILWKRKYWEEKLDNTLIEFSVSDINYWSDNAREKFEKVIQRRLEKYWIICEKIPEKELIQKVIENFKTKLEEMIEQFINRCKQRKWSPKKVSEILSRNSVYQDWKIGMFYQFGLKCYEKYEEKMKKSGKKDFNDILIWATEKIHQEKWNIQIRINKKHNIQSNLLNIKYLMIDEYQDFSELYYELIVAILKYNNDINIICVGDDWQLINSFSWSQKDFYKKYEEKFLWGKRLNLLETWRCPQEIVSISNKLMCSLGEWTKCWKWHNGKIEGKYIWSIFIECRKDKKEDYEKDTIYFAENKWDKRGWAMEKERYLKFCCEKILDWKKNNKNTTFLIMSAFNEKPFTKWELIETYIKILTRDYWTKKDAEKEIITKLEKEIIVQTVHKSKWAEADVCILLQVWKKEKTGNTKFPFLHPDYIFWKIFWDTTSTVLEEQRRLFYVALTRTKQDLYFISEEEFSQPADDFLISSFNEWYNKYVQKAGAF